MSGRRLVAHTRAMAAYSRPVVGPSREGTQCNPDDARISELVVLAEPLANTTEARLVIRGGFRTATVGGEAGMAELYPVRGTGLAPRARCHGDTVELTYPDSEAVEGAVEAAARERGGARPGRDVVTVDRDSTSPPPDLNSHWHSSGSANRRVPCSLEPDRQGAIGMGEVEETAADPALDVDRATSEPGEVGAHRVDPAEHLELPGDRSVQDDGIGMRTGRGCDRLLECADSLTVTTTADTKVSHVRNSEVMFAANNWLVRFGANGVVWPTPDVA
jgi:hypothetical protein